jgi:hypothetical protein
MTNDSTGYKREGSIPVDSGQIMLIDPCYIKKDFESDDAPAGLNYAGACNVTLSDKRCGRFGGPALLAFATSTAHGDGCYPVYVKRDAKGRVISVRVDFDADDDEDVCKRTVRTTNYRRQQ